MDGKFEDWQSISPIYEDPAGDQLQGYLDFGKLWITNDARYLYLRIEVGTEINLQDANAITLFLDADANPSTGKKINSIGADLIYQFGKREGIIWSQSDSISISSYSVGLVTFPTVSSSQFEIAISRVALPDGKRPLFSGKKIKILFKDLGEGADSLPNDNVGIEYTFTDHVPSPIKSISIKRENKESLRLMTNNMLTDGLFKPDQSAAILRILKAIQPEIICFQEVYSHSAAEVLAQIATILPPSPEWKWYGAKVGDDIVVVSKYRIKTDYVIEGNGAFVIDLRPLPGHRPNLDSELLLINAHFPCCANNEGRQLEMDAVMNFIRRAKNSEGEIQIPRNTPIILLGDFNMVGYAQQLRTLLYGDIVNRHLYGDPFSPDWDNSSFADLLPLITGMPFAFTWYDPNSMFSPGRLDFMIYSDSVIQPVKKFVLFTPALPADSLTAYNLERNDSQNASDHLPVVADFIFTKN